MRRQFKRKSRTRVLGPLLLVSLVTVVLPKPFTGALSSVIQILVPLQHTFSSLEGGAEAPAMRFSAQEVEQLERRLLAYENQFASLRIRIHELEEFNVELSGIRRRGLDGGRLIPARIVSSDSLPWRESRLIDRGTLAGLGPDHAVVSRLVLTSGEPDGVRDGMSILSAEVLVGEVVRANTHTANILLVSDREAQPRLVRIGRPSAGGFEALPAEFMMHGIGRGRMEIRGVSRNHIEQRAIRTGDVVLTSASDDRLPVAVMVGEIAEILPDDDNGVLYNLRVKPALDLDNLKRVYVVDARPAE